MILVCDPTHEGPRFINNPRHQGCGPSAHIGLAFGKHILHEVMKGLDGCCSIPTPYDLAETDDEYILSIPLPGHDAKDVSVSVKGTNVLIEAERKEEHAKEEAPADANKPRPIINMGQYTWNRPRIEVNIPLKDEIEPENVKARIDRGILTVRFKKKPAAKIAVAE